MITKIETINNKQVTTIYPEDGKLLVKNNGGFGIYTEYTLKNDESEKDFVEIYNQNDYRVARSFSYPSIGDQLDAIWHTIDNGEPLNKDCLFYKMIAEVKNKYPKE